MYGQKVKKGFIELTSFVLLTSLILVISLTSYLILSDIFDDQIRESQKESFTLNLKKINIELSQISSFTGSSFSYPVNIEKGALKFKNDSLIYLSEVKFINSEELCFDDICYGETNGFETIRLVLSNNMTFQKNFTLSKQRSIITFTNLGGNKIDVKFK